MIPTVVGDEQQRNVRGAASGVGPAGSSTSSPRRGNLISNMSLRSTRPPTEMAMKLAGMDLSDDALLDALLRLVGLRYKSQCVLLVVEAARVTCAALWGKPFKYEEPELLDSPRLFRAIRRRAPAIINDVTQNPATLHGVLLDSTIRGYVQAPVCLSNQYVGSVVMTFSEPQQFTLSHMSDFQTATSNIGELLEAKLQSAADNSLHMQRDSGA